MIRINVIKDEEADVLIAFSPDVKGLVVEADTFEALQAEVSELVLMLLKPLQQTEQAITYYHLPTSINYKFLAKQST
ncbi:MAG: DUF1902 domain-containing protein [Gammaproteobacteria bacterium]|nr:DUF1902 domain-containing protein [Gammaproteobacteria bacterium]